MRNKRRLKKSPIMPKPKAAACSSPIVCGELLLRAISKIWAKNAQLKPTKAAKIKLSRTSITNVAGNNTMRSRFLNAKNVALSGSAMVPVPRPLRAKHGAEGPRVNLGFATLLLSGSARRRFDRAR